MCQLVSKLRHFPVIAVLLLLQSCETPQGGYFVDNHPPCSQYKYTGKENTHEARQVTLDFPSSSCARLPNIRGYYGGNESECLKRGEYVLLEQSRKSQNVNLASASNANRYAEYFSETFIRYEDIFLPEQWTLQFWISPTASGVVMEENIDHGKTFVVSLTDDNRISLRLPPSDNAGTQAHTLTSESAVTADKWHHIAITLSNTDNAVSFFVDGNMDHSPSFTSNHNVLAERSSKNPSLCFGSCAPPGNSFTGKLDSVEFTSQVLSSTEISANYQRLKHQFL